MHPGWPCGYGSDGPATNTPEPGRAGRTRAVLEAPSGRDGSPSRPPCSGAVGNWARARRPVSKRRPANPRLNRPSCATRVGAHRQARPSTGAIAAVGVLLRAGHRSGRLRSCRTLTSRTHRPGYSNHKETPTKTPAGLIKAPKAHLVMSLPALDMTGSSASMKLFFVPPSSGINP